ncbi:MAG: DUF29 family protein [Candidatus Methylumidiphilus sp.]
MGATAIQSDFVMLLQSQLTALQVGNREALDLPLLASEFESVVGGYRNEIRERAEIIIGILMRTNWVYGDWTALKLQRDLLLGALDDSPCLLGSADSQVAAAYEHASCTASVHGEHHWPKATPWPTLQMLLDTVGNADRQYLALEQSHDRSFAQLEPIPKTQSELILG